MTKKPIISKRSECGNITGYREIREIQRILFSGNFLSRPGLSIVDSDSFKISSTDLRFHTSVKLVSFLL